MLGPGRHHPEPRRPRRRGHQGRAAPGRLHPPDDLADRRGHVAACTSTSTGARRAWSSTCGPRRASQAFQDLVRDADAVVEAMRPGALARRGLGYERPEGDQPRRSSSCTISGYGMTGPYKDLPSHGIAYDTWAGLVPPAYDDEGFCYIPEHAVDRHPRRSALRRPGHPRRHHPGPRPRARAASGDRPVRRRRGHGLAPQRDLEGLRAPRGRGHRQQGRRLRAPGPGHRGHEGGRPLPDLRERPTATCCSWRRSRRSGRTSARASAGRSCSRSGRGRSTPTTPGATASCSASCRTSSRTKTTGSGSTSATSTTRRSRR